MRRATVVFMTAVIWLIPNPQGARGDVDVDIAVSINSESNKAFYFAIGKHYGVQETEVLIIRKRRIPDDELPVVFFLAQRARVAPSVIVGMRLGGRSWMGITAHFGLTAEIFYVPVTRVYGPPYGKAYGHYKNRHRSQWGAIRLTDAETIHLVNLKFLSEHHGCPPDKIIAMREKGQNIIQLHAKVKGHKGAAGKHKPRTVRPSEQRDGGSHGAGSRGPRTSGGGRGKGGGGRRGK